MLALVKIHTPSNTQVYLSDNILHTEQETVMLSTSVSNKDQEWLKKSMAEQNGAIWLVLSTFWNTPNWVIVDIISYLKISLILLIIQVWVFHNKLI